MAKVKEVVEEVAVAVVEPKVVVATPDSDAKTAFRQVMATYQLQNPAKYELKREALEAKLNTL
jgi:hypothetical protein